MTWFKDETVEDIINNAKTILEIGKDVLDLAPVPGLSAVMGTVNTLLERIQVRTRRVSTYRWDPCRPLS